MRDMTPADDQRLAAHPLSRSLFKKLLRGSSDGLAHRVAELGAGDWRHLRTLAELGYVSIDDARVIVEFTVSSLVRMGYVG